MDVVDLQNESIMNRNVSRPSQQAASQGTRTSSQVLTYVFFNNPLFGTDSDLNGMLEEIPRSGI